MDISYAAQSTDLVPSLAISGHPQTPSTIEQPSAETPLTRLLRKLPDHQLFLGDGFIASCQVPSHEGSPLALSVDVENGRVKALRCIDGCTEQQILDALHLTKDDLWPPATNEDLSVRESLLQSFAEFDCQPNGEEPSPTVKELMSIGAASDGLPSPTETPIPRAATLEDISTLTDIGLSRRLIVEADGSIRFLRDQGHWITWTGTHWETDVSMIGQQRAAKAVGDALWDEFQRLPRDRATAQLLAAVKSASSNKAVNAMITLARSEPAVCADSSMLDANPRLLNCRNGILDLEALELHPHDPARMLTKLAGAAFDHSATCPRWETFIDEVTCGDRELGLFLQRSFGVAISGNVSSHAFWVHYGRGANGKSTAMEVVSKVLGDYAGPIAAEALLANPKGNDKERSLITGTMTGKRLVVAAEPDSGMRLSEGVIKSLTGAETVEARFLYGQPFKVVPTWHPHFSTNHKPDVRGTDLAIWRRVMLVPWNATFTGNTADPDLKERLFAEADGILTWLAEGYASFRRIGLAQPASVQAATNEYRQENDSIGSWLEECCAEDSTAQVLSADLYASYLQWCKNTKEHSLNKTCFGRELSDRNYIGHKVGGRRVWTGIRLANGQEQD
jgi:putative DNA primase/helicase